MDMRGSSCGETLIRLAVHARTNPAAHQLAVLSDDPAATSELAAWCRLTGHRYLPPLPAPRAERPPPSAPQPDRRVPVNRFAVTVTHALGDPDRATVAVVIANAAAASAKTTLLFLSNDGVHLAVPGYADAIHHAGFAPLTELLDSFTAAGGQILVCTPCAKTRGVALENLIAGDAPGGGAGLVEFMTADGGAASVSY